MYKIWHFTYIMSCAEQVWLKTIVLIKMWHLSLHVLQPHRATIALMTHYIQINTRVVYLEGGVLVTVVTMVRPVLLSVLLHKDTRTKTPGQSQVHWRVMCACHCWLTVWIATGGLSGHIYIFSTRSQWLEENHRQPLQTTYLRWRRCCSVSVYNAVTFLPRWTRLYTVWRVSRLLCGQVMMKVVNKPIRWIDTSHHTSQSRPY